MNAKITANAKTLRRWLKLSEETLGNHSDRLNAINIFPVADGDTGSNLYRTVSSARRATPETGSLGDVLGAAAEGAMEDAQGNSGTILAVILSAMAEVLGEASRLSPELLSRSLERAQIRSWSALSEPASGTMLSVLEAAAQGASDAVAALGTDDNNNTLSLALDNMANAAFTAVQRTEDQLEPLKQEHVVDAGGVGLFLILLCLRAEILGVPVRDYVVDDFSGYELNSEHIYHSIPAEGIEIMCTITLTALDAATLRMKLDSVGDSVIMTPLIATDQQQAQRWRVHVHTMEKSEVLRTLGEFGEPQNVTTSSLRAAS